MTKLSELKKINVAGTWHIVTEVQLHATSLRELEAWLVKIQQDIPLLIDGTKAQEKHNVRVKGYYVDLPEVSGLGIIQSKL